MRKKYIAYGSNMDEEQMAYRCPTAKLLGVAEIQGYELLFKGSLTGAYATIEPKTEGTVPVLIWEIGKGDERHLDHYEGCPTFYYKKDLIATMAGEEIKAMAYIMDERRSLGLPRRHYYDVLEKAYQRFDFDMVLLENAYATSKPENGVRCGF